MLFRKMLRDMRHHKMQFIAVFLMAFLGFYVSGGLSGEWYGIETYLEKYHQQTNLSDVWVYSTNFTEQDAQNATGISGVLGAERRLKLKANGQSEASPTLHLYFLEENTQSLPVVMQGDNIDPSDTQSIWLDAKFTEATGLSVGDSYSFRIGNLSMQRTIAGLVYSPEYTYYKASTALTPDHKEIGFGFLSAQGFPVKDFLLDNLESGDTDAKELLEDMLTDDYVAFVDSAVNEHYDGLIDAMVDDDYDGLIEEMVESNYDGIIDTLVKDNREEMIDRYVTDNHEAIIDKMVEENYDEILGEYVRENYDELLEDYVRKNRDSLVTAYVYENYDALLTRYINENRDTLIAAYVEQNYDTLVDSYIDRNFESFLDVFIATLYTPEEIALTGMTTEALRQAVLDQYGEAAIRETAKQNVKKEDVATTASVSLSDSELRGSVAQQFTKADAEKAAAESLSDAELVAMAKQQYSVDDVVELVKTDYSVGDIKGIVRDEYSDDDIKREINENYTDEDIRELLHDNYMPEDLGRIVREEYTPEDVKELVKDYYPPDEMKTKLLADYTPDELRDILLAQYPGGELREMLYGSVAAMDAEELRSDMVFNELLLKTNRTDLPVLEKELDGVLENGVLMLLGRESVYGVSQISKSMGAHKTISSIFPIAFITIAILTIITTMSRIIASQRMQIGTLKALGFSQRKVLLHYLGYGFFPSAAGAFLGVALGAPTLTPAVYWALKKIYALPEWQARTAPFLWVVAALCAFACAASVFLAVRGVLAECPAESLRPKASGKLSLTWVAESRLWQKLSFRVQWNLRDAFRGKIRSLMGIVGAMSAMALLIFSFSLRDTFDDMMGWLFNDIQKYSTQLILSDDVGTGEVEALAEQLSGQLLMISAVELRNGSAIETVPLTVVEDTELYCITDTGHNPLRLRDGDIALSRKLAQRLGVGTDGSLSWRIDDDEGWTAIRATVFHVAPMTQDMVMTRSTLEALGGEYTPASIITGDSIERFDSDLISAVHTRIDRIEAWNLTMEVLNLIAMMLILAALILSIVVMYNLGLLSFSEKERELATLKVLGFKSGAIRRLLLTQNLWLSVLGMLVGIPLGYWLSNITVTMLSSEFDLIAVHTGSSLALSAAVVLAISVFTNLLFSRKLKTLDMVTAFKSVD